jgi:hypothetical protein
MSYQTPDPHDELLRAALDAEADDVVAGPELLDRIRTDAAKPDRRRLAPWLLVAAAAAALIGIGAVLLRDEDQSVDISEDPTSTTMPSTTDTTDIFDALAGSFPCEGDGGSQTVFYLASSATPEQVDAVGSALDVDPRVQSVRFITQAEVAAALEAAEPEADWSSPTIPTGYLTTFLTTEDDLAVRGVVSDLPGIRATSSTECTDAASPGTERPPVVALVREDGWLVGVDLATGEQRELYFGGDPNATSDVEEGGPSFIDGVDLSPDGEWIYFSTCCEPAVGQTFRIPLEGGEPEQIAMGAHPRVSPDGRFVATGGSDTVIVTPIDGSTAQPATIEVTCCPRSLAWSPDGTQLAVVVGTGAEGEVPQVRLFGWDGTSLTPRDMGKPDNPGWFVSWTPEDMPTISSGDPIADDRSLSQDATYGWLLWVDEAGVVRQQAGHESGDRTPITVLPEALTADW